MKYCIKSSHTKEKRSSIKDFVRGVDRAKLEFKTKKEAGSYLRDNIVEVNRFMIVKCQ